MSRLKYILLPLLLSLVLFACNNNNYIEEEAPVVPPVTEPEVPEELPVPFEPVAPFQYLTIVDLSLSSKYSVINEETQEVILNVNHSIADVQRLAYVVHRKVDGAAVGGEVFSQERIGAEMKNGVFSIGKRLLEGEYYVSVVAVMNDDGFHNILTPALHENYDEAVVQVVGNAYTYYATMEIEVKADEGAINRGAMQLQKKTTDLVFQFADINQLPSTKDKYLLEVGVENIPSAFYLATGLTLTDQEVKAKELYRCKGQRVFKLPLEKKTKYLVTQFHSLANDNLANNATERGTYWYELIEKVEGGESLVERVSSTVGKCNTVKPSFHLMTAYLISEKP